MSAALLPKARLALLGAAWLSCCAANAEEPALQGVFVNPAQSDEPIKIAIEAAAKEFNFIMRPIARSRLKKTNPVIHRVEIARSGQTVTITLGTTKPTTTEPGRGPVKWTRDDGEIFNVSTDWRGSALEQAFVATDGTRVNRYSISPDGSTLVLQVTLTSPQLKAPVQYALNFKRQPLN